MLKKGFFLSLDAFLAVVMALSFLISIKCSFAGDMENFTFEQSSKEREPDLEKRSGADLTFFICSSSASGVTDKKGRFIFK